METARQIQPSRILIVDDEARNLKLMTVLLQEEGYAFDTARSGREALDKVRDFRPDLIFLDVMMTALTDRDSRLRGLEVGANDFLSKPVDRTELLVRARNLLQINGERQVRGKKSHPRCRRRSEKSRHHQCLSDVGRF